MLKKFNSFEEFKYFFENFEYGELIEYIRRVYVKGIRFTNRWWNKLTRAWLFLAFFQFVLLFYIIYEHFI